MSKRSGRARAKVIVRKPQPGLPWLLGALLVLGGILFSLQAHAQADRKLDLEGRWAGWGAVQMHNGESERVRCVATYFITAAGRSLKQNLRCASPSYSIDAVADLEVQGQRVTGKWEERKTSTDGAVIGQLTADGMRLAIQGQAFSAGLQLSSSNCKQTISIEPQGIDVRKISIGLDRC